MSVASELAAAVMSLESTQGGRGDDVPGHAYMYGHRDARHGAADLITHSPALAKLERDRAALLAACRAMVAASRNDNRGLAAAREQADQAVRAAEGE